MKKILICIILGFLSSSCLDNIFSDEVSSTRVSVSIVDKAKANFTKISIIGKKDSSGYMREYSLITLKNPEDIQSPRRDTIKCGFANGALTHARGGVYEIQLTQPDQKAAIALTSS